MTYDIVRRIIKKRVTRLSRVAAKADRGFDKDDIHDLRVATKKLRAFVRFLAEDMHCPGLKLTAGTKRLYHIAGALRDVQLELDSLLAKDLQVPQYIQKLRSAIALQERQWKKYYSAGVFKQLEQKLLSYGSGTIHAKGLSGFFNTRITLIKEVAAIKSPADGQVHSVRKHAKDIIYLSELTKKEWPAAKHGIDSATVKKLILLAAIIGDYQDMVVTRGHLDSFAPRNVSKEEQELVKSLCRQYTDLIAEEKIRIMNTLRELFELKRDKLLRGRYNKTETIR